jgi:hypothetical protein
MSAVVTNLTLERSDQAVEEVGEYARRLPEELPYPLPYIPPAGSRKAAPDFSGTASYLQEN